MEIALLQKFGLLLGHPNHALSVVLASLLFTTGLGLLSAKPIVVLAVGNLRFVGYAAGRDRPLRVPGGLPEPARPSWPGPSPSAADIVVLLVAPLGLCLGTFFPLGPRGHEGHRASFTPWAWGVNGNFSVVAPILSVAVSMTFGTSALLLAAVPVYLLASLVLPSALADARTERAA